MSSIIFLKRVFTGKEYWLSVLAAIVLLMSSVIYSDLLTGEEYTFITLFYDDATKEALEYGQISIRNLVMGYDKGYLWMFCPIIVGIPCVILNRTERFMMFRTGRNKYIFAKLFSNIITSGLIPVIAYLVYATVGMILIKENIWDLELVRKFLSVFAWGVLCAIPSIILSEFVRNKYLILCIPFVFNYFMGMFISGVLPYSVSQYINPHKYQIIFLLEKAELIPCVIILVTLLAGCMVLKKIMLERRCDCGQQ